VVMRADGEDAVAMMRWHDLMKLLGNEFTPAQPEAHPSPQDGD